MPHSWLVGNDPDNVAQGAKTGSQLVKNVVKPGQQAEGSIQQMVMGKEDVDLNGITLSKTQVC